MTTNNGAISQRIGCVMMHKDEDLLIDEWLSYYSNLFGFENICIVDNGSTSDTVMRSLTEAERRGVHVDRSHATSEDFRNKGPILGNKVFTWAKGKGIEKIFLIDCDEFLVVFDDDGFSCDPERIIGYINTLQSGGKTFRIGYELSNVGGERYRFFLQSAMKTFYDIEDFAWTDQGSHHDGSRHQAGFQPTSLLYIHYHHKPFARYVSDAVRKLIGVVDPTDKAALLQLQESRGPGCHLVKPLLSDESEYMAMFDDVNRVYLWQFEEHMRAIFGSDRAFSGFESSIRNERRPAFVQLPTGGSIAYDGALDKFVNFNGRDYWHANPDVWEANHNPLTHYLLFGCAEKRRLGR